MASEIPSYNRSPPSSGFPPLSSSQEGQSSVATNGQTQEIRHLPEINAGNLGVLKLQGPDFTALKLTSSPP